MKRIALLLAASAVSACSVIDTGEVDYRRAETLSGSMINEHLIDQQKTCPAENLGSGKKPAKGTQCVPLLPVKLFRQNVGSNNTITKNDVYSIRLEHGLIAYMTEPKISFRRLAVGKKPFRRVGEVVILANTFEFPAAGAAADGKTASAAPRFTELSALSDSKVIYYSPDVEAGQDLNFSNIPLQSPVRYQGNPVGIQIIALELDRMSSGMQSLLKKLASLGQTSNIVAGGPVAGLLLDLGTSLLTQNNDDIIFEYRFVLDPSDDGLSATSSPFEAGRYVVMRTDERREDQIWRNFELDHNTGKLYHLRSAGATTAEGFADNTYFTVNIIKHPAGTEPSSFGFRSLDEVGKEIAADADSRDASLEVVNIAVQKRTSEIRGGRWAKDLSEAWNETQTRARLFTRSIAVVPEDEQDKCTANPGAAASQDIAEAAARTAALRFVRLFKEARDAETVIDGESQPIFGQSRQEILLSSLVPFFAPFEDGAVERDNLVYVDSFATTYLAEDMTLFPEAVIKEAKRENRKNCAELILLRLASPKVQTAEGQPEGGGRALR